MGLLVMFICVHCPYVKHVETELAKIGEDYEGLIAIAAVQSNDVAEYPAEWARAYEGTGGETGVSLPLPSG